jgi:trigger factor
MNITRNNIDDLNAVLTVEIDKNDYKDKVEKTLQNYRKSASIKGFRKGQVPMGFVKKQYEKSIIFDEVNQLLQKGINDYIQNEKLSILGNPLPKAQDSLDWDAERLNFEFELGMAPDFKVDLKKIKTDAYKINVTDDEVQKYVDNFAKRFGDLMPVDKVEEGANVKVQLKELDKDKNEKENGVEKETFLFVDELKNAKKFIGKKVGDEIVVKAKDLYEDPMNLEQLLGKTADEIKDIDSQIQFTVSEITKLNPSEINQSLFDKVYGENAVKSEEEFRTKIKEEAEKMYNQETDKQLMNDVVEDLIKTTKFDLPLEFLSRWLEFSNDKIESLEQAKEEVGKMEDSLRYQLIEAKIAENYDLKVEHEDVLNSAKNTIKNQFAMYGQMNIPDEDIDKIVQNSLNNEQEYRRIADQVFADKMLQVFKDNVSVKEKGITFDEFVEIMNEKSKAHQHSHEHNHGHDHKH